MAELRDPADRGELRISNRVVERIAVHVAASIPGVGAADKLPRVEVAAAGGHVTLSVDVAVTWPEPVAEVAGRVRGAVATTVEGLTPYVVDRTDVRVRSVVGAVDPGRVR